MSLPDQMIDRWQDRPDRARASCPCDRAVSGRASRRRTGYPVKSGCCGCDRGRGGRRTRRASQSRIIPTNSNAQGQLRRQPVINGVFTDLVSLHGSARVSRVVHHGTVIELGM